ncbi:hypothetical protein GGD62_000560 [Bradyrhizobium sp. ERR14]|nr:hypothetical protein [Bradyrhizobium sp. ERR14]
MGDLVSILGGATLGLVVGFRKGGFIKAATVRKDGRRDTAYYMLESLSEPGPDNIDEMVRFYDTCAGFYDGSADAEGDFAGIVERIREQVLDLILAVGQAIQEMKSPYSRERVRVCLDYAMRAGVPAERLEQERIRLDAAYQLACL